MGVADARTSLAFTLLAIDLRRWSDSASRVLAARPPRKGGYVKWEAVVAGPGTVAGSMSLARTINPTDTTIILLVTDTAFRGVRTALSMDEARALTAAMKRAALASLPTTVPPMTKARRHQGAAAPKKPHRHGPQVKRHLNTGDTGVHGGHDRLNQASKLLVVGSSPCAPRDLRVEMSGDWNR